MRSEREPITSHAPLGRTVWSPVDSCAPQSLGGRPAVLPAPTTSPSHRPCGQGLDGPRGFLVDHARIRLAESHPRTHGLAFMVSLHVSIPPYLRSRGVNSFEARDFFLRRWRLPAPVPATSAGLPCGLEWDGQRGRTQTVPCWEREPGPDSGAGMSRAPQDEEAHGRSWASKGGWVPSSWHGDRVLCVAGTW